MTGNSREVLDMVRACQIKNGEGRERKHARPMTKVVMDKIFDAAENALQLNPKNKQLLFEYCHFEAQAATAFTLWTW